MNLIIDGVPTYVYLSGLRYNINYDFRNCLLFENLLNNDDLSQEDKLYSAINIFFGDQYIEDYEEAFKKIIWFYTCGKDIKQTTEKNIKPIFSYEIDDGYIFAAFVEVYKIDLTTEKLHWWKFKALFDALPDTCYLNKIMSYRAVKINNNMTDSEKKFYRNMKKLFELPDNRTKEEKEADFADALFG